jgi:hypothetical protein
MAEQKTVRIIDATDGKLYSVVLDEATKVLISNASDGVAHIKTAILANGNNSYTDSEAEALAVRASFLIHDKGLYA